MDRGVRLPKHRSIIILAISLALLLCTVCGGVNDSRIAATK
jgi:hypothetical protein